ncbi:kell blood group glycoprotein isoform X2 [Scophthalmus maximus]|uniref:kell blood group glycoprotein isoform X2 n=1 Tax=Scophthalmus maximus TaxID=52904 RepID=UPI001FA8B935|nr:kell blood group glycoprotein isoform X2 [Scophthalmus maximus]
MLRMSETPIELEPQLSIQPSSQTEVERGLRPPPLLQLPLPNQDPSEIQQQTQLQPEIPLSESGPEHQHQAKSLWIRHRGLLLLLLGFSLCAALSGLIYYMQLNPRNESNNQTGTVTQCLSPACQRASARLSMSADPFMEPCDYFLFTCDRLARDSRGRQRGQGIPGHPQNQNGKSRRPESRGENKEREDRGLRGGERLDRKTVLLQYLREILESNNREGGSAVQKAKGFYHSCLDTKTIETAGVEPFLTLIQKLGGWAVSGQWNKTDFNSTLSLLMRDYATFPFFNLYVGKDPEETALGSTKRYIQIDQPDLLIPIEWNSKTLKSEAKAEVDHIASLLLTRLMCYIHLFIILLPTFIQTIRPFLATCQRYLALLGALPSSSMIHVGMFMSLSSELAVAATPLQYRLSRGQLFQRMSIKELQIQAPAIDWLGCLRAAFHPLHLIEDDHVLLHNLPYMVHMSPIIGKWLNKHEPSNSGPLQTYMVLNLLHTLMPALDSRFSETVMNVSVGNADVTSPRWKRCVLETERGFDSVLTHLLRERTAHREAEEIIQNIFSSFKSKLHELKWRDQKSLQSVMTKVQSLIPRLWTTSEISGEAELDLLFSTVSVGTHGFFSNYVQLLSLWQKRRRKLLTEQIESADILSVTPLLLRNELLFPMGMFVPPLFHPTYPRAMNYGVMGFLMAKDILHLLLPDKNAGRGGAFSLSAAQRQEVWVQYSALQIALQAYHQSLKSSPADTSISGFSHTRLFLSSFSQVNCDFDPYNEFMPLEPSFLITVICAKSHLCPTSLQCPSKTQQHSLQTC